MKKQLTYILCLAAACLVMPSCDNDNEQDVSSELSVKVFSPVKVVPGQEVIISGTGLDRAETVIFPGNVKVPVASHTGSGTITVVTPDGLASEGGELQVEAEGKTVSASVPLSVGNPAVSVLSPFEEITAGDELTIVGEDLEFIREAVFPSKDGGITVKALDFARKATSQLRIKVPIGITEGLSAISLVTVGGRTLLTPEITLVDKPTGQWVEVEKTAWSGEFDLNGWGNNFYIMKDWFPGICPGSRITFYFRIYNGWGQFKLNLGDWGKYNWPEIPDANDGGMMVTSDLLGGAEATQFSITLTDNIYDPWFTVGSPEGRCLIINGERFIMTKITYTVTQWQSFDEPADQPKDVVWEGSIGPLDWSEAGKLWLKGELLAKFTPGRTMGIDFECPSGAADGYYVRIMGGWWTKLPTAIADFNNTEWERHEFSPDATNYEITLTQADIDILVQQESILFCGSGIVLKRLYLRD